MESSVLGSQLIGVISMFVLRLGVPLAITLLVGYGLRRLDAKWQAEARTRLEAHRAWNKKEIESAIEMYHVIEQPCWVLRECPESVRLDCPACQQPDIPCWMARRQAEGRLPSTCYYCELFSLRQVAEAEAVEN